MNLNKNSALLFIVILGFVSLFADMTYEGAKSITGQYLQILGASGTIVGTVAGLGEFIGYAFRLVSGYISDQTRRYWFITFLGYAINLLAVPLLALANRWEIAASLIVLERFGKAIRAPAKDAILSHATHQVGHGWGFGLHEAMDQTGAILGPLIMSFILWMKGSYQESFAFLLIPALCALSILVYARILYPHPENLEIKNKSVSFKGFTKPFWIYIVAISCIAAGYADFALIAFHLKKETLASDFSIPLLFAIAMGAAGLSALFFGKLYDKKGLSSLVLSTGLSAFFAPLAFFNNYYSAVAGIILWGIGLGAQESVMKAVVAHLIPIAKRGTGYGMLNIWFGLSWFIGSAIMGYLYDISIPALMIFSILMQSAAIPLLLKVRP